MDIAGDIMNLITGLNAKSRSLNSYTLGELGDKISGEETAKVEAEIENTKKALESNNTESFSY